MENSRNQKKILSGGYSGMWFLVNWLESVCVNLCKETKCCHYSEHQTRQPQHPLHKDETDNNTLPSRGP